MEETRESPPPSTMESRESPPTSTTRASPDDVDAHHSDKDSLCGAPLTRDDWRLYQVKTRLFTSSIQVTQYWSWKDQDRLLEHQVLGDVEPISWGLHRAPIDFHVRLDDVVEVRWNVDALQVRLVTDSSDSRVSSLDGKPRGDVMAAFKRENTIRRFLSFCRARGLKTTEVSADEMDAEWGAMKSEQLPVRDDEASEVLKE